MAVAPMAVVTSWVLQRRCRCLEALVVLMSLLGGAAAMADPRTAPFALECRVQNGETIRLRLHPRLQQVELLDPRSDAVRQTITTSQPPRELGPGIIDDSVVRISDREIVWEETMYRPQFLRERHRIDRVSLAYVSEETIQIEMGPEMAEQTRSGVCHPIETPGSRSSAHR